jgi:hypothetical protein
MTKRASHHVRRQRLRRIPTQPDHDFPPQLTAQPKSLPAELAIALEEHDDRGLSVDPEDLGTHFLTEAIEQGDFDPERATVREFSLFEPAEPDNDAPSVEVATFGDEIAESENLRSPERRSGFAPAGAHAASERGSAAQTMLRFGARVLRDLAKRLQRGHSRSERQ